MIYKRIPIYINHFSESRFYRPSGRSAAKLRKLGVFFLQLKIKNTYLYQYFNFLEKFRLKFLSSLLVNQSFSSILAKSKHFIHSNINITRYLIFITKYYSTKSQHSAETNIFLDFNAIHLA